jgi:hypothetical protein
MNQQLVKRSAESVLFDFNCSQILGAAETITSVVSVAGEGSGAALTFGAAAVNAAPVLIDYGRELPAGKVIRVLIGGGQSPVSYVVRVIFQTSNPGEVREATVRLLVIDEPEPPLAAL